MELANGCRPHPTLALAFQRMETPVSCTSLNWPANFPELPNGRQRLPSLGLGPWATAGTEAICDQSARATWARKAPAVLQTEEIVQEFFQRGRRNQSSGWRPPRFQVASSVLVSAGLYAALLRRFLRQRPFGRSVILVPRLSRAREICRFHFDVKIYDEAESLQRPTKTTNKLKNIAAKFVGEFSFTFGSAKVDYKYSVQNAWFEGHLSPVQCFALPLAADSDQRLTWLAHFIQQQQQNWSPMLVLFYQTAAARDFAQRLQSLRVSAEACLPSTKRKGEGSLSNERARADVMCLAKGRAADFALTGLNTVILAEPTRRPRSLCYMQRMMQAQVGRFMPMKLIEVMDGRSRAKMTAYHAHFSHTVGWGIVDTVVDADTGVPRIGGGPQLLDLCGRRFPPSPLNLQHLLKSQVAPQVRSWLQELHAWLQEHQRKPRQSGGLVERLQEARLRRAYHHLRENVLNEEEIKVLAACADLLDSEARPEDTCHEIFAAVQVTRKLSSVELFFQEELLVDDQKTPKTLVEAGISTGAEVQVVFQAPKPVKCAMGRDESGFPREDLVFVTIPSSVARIPNEAFQGCGKLMKVEIPSTVTSIGQRAFTGCCSLASVTIPDGVAQIEDLTFFLCKALVKVEIPDTVVSIGLRAFADCSSLAELNIPHSVTDLGVGAFQDCLALSNVTIPCSVTRLGDGCREVQLAIEMADEESRWRIAAELQDHVWDAACGPHANHVLQKCILVMHPNHVQFIVDVLVRQQLVSQAARHKSLGSIELSKNLD
eukprot:g7237.t3